MHREFSTIVFHNGIVIKFRCLSVMRNEFEISICGGNDPTQANRAATQLAREYPTVQPEKCDADELATVLRFFSTAF